MAASQPNPRPIVVVTGGGAHVWAMINDLADRVGPVSVVLEIPESKKQLLRGRARRQGWISAIGQLGTMVLSRLGKRLNVKHAARLIAEEKLETEPRQGQVIIHVASANGPECLQAIETIKPGVVLLNGCRLISREMLAKMPCPVLNYHAGITPKYRGMNGGYWALTSGDPQNFGTTVHLVDAGVDTGGVLKQVRGEPKQGDTISSYALRQAAFSRDICVEAVSDALAGKLATFDPGLPSKLWYHPTIWFYVWTGLRTGIW
ncbi:formyl transferase [Mesorhizobium sp. B2-5-9]|uniref:phosphoribosylglycinamide formyltransferase 1 n=1 Tax=Mesorhizobium australicum (strain HAMBI 3006 / LMG 24608 / WSM2073) TaxID=754035 RepID=L0KLK0_MESAW|nr:MULTISPECIES: formyl transferase [Mesorhizobium]AGB46006.1 folate-dependent phosphoribosylglycinamide formyltransferase PurN [Mesorhizobium australicum WSM2073]MBZ9975001.1 formyl transferase [Mesorhizobium sp. BR-1-1-10]TPK10582.1 formyl transferase [Mesorhizobium sp. B2-5-9]TPK84755.1 formyl transferase [Mesorhizobium sp. B2-4-13]TPL87727.1 formyl transferase [Mesorhizobium sp. B2-3-14]